MPDVTESDLVEQLYTSADDPAGLREALRHAVKEADGSGGNIHVVDKASLHSVMFVCWGARYESANVEAYFRHWRHINIHRAAMRRTRGVFFCHEHVSEETLAKAPYAQDFYFKMGERWLAGAVASSDPRFEVSLVFNRSEGQPAFGDDTRRLITNLLPHVRRAASMAARGVLKAGVETGVSEGIAQASRPVWLVDANLKVMWSNAAAVEMARSGGLIQERAGRLALSHEQLKLAALVRSAVNRRLEGASACALLVQDDERALELEVMPATVPDGALSGVHAVAMVMGRVIGLSADVQERLQSHLGLTATEARLAAEVARGSELEAISESRGVSNETVRTQLRSIYMKAGVTRQAELAALVWKLAG